MTHAKYVCYAALRGGIFFDLRYSGGVMNFRQYIGDIDFQLGTVTDRATGKVWLYRDWVRYVNDSRRAELAEMLKQRDTRRDDQNLPGNKPWFEDDWFGYFPEQQSNRGRYPYELGYRGSYPPES